MVVLYKMDSPGNHRADIHARMRIALIVIVLDRADVLEVVRTVVVVETSWCAGVVDPRIAQRVHWGLRELHPSNQGAARFSQA